MSAKSTREEQRQEAIQTLLAPVGEPKYGRGIKPGDTIYTILRHRSSSARPG